MNSQDYLNTIRKYLAWFVNEVTIDNGTNYFDLNKHAERFLIPIFNAIFDGDFKRLEYDDINYPAVDLGDKTQRIAIQVTSETGYGKITRTIESFISHKKYLDFDKLYHLIIHSDYKTSKKQEDINDFIIEKISTLELDLAPTIVFKLKENVWNISKLKFKIEKYCSIEQQRKIAEHLQSEYEQATESFSSHNMLVEYKSAFKIQLDKNNNGLLYQLHNEFFGRKDKLAEFEAFAVGKEKVLVIVAEGGYGKTRLCIQYFEHFVDSCDERDAYLFVPANFNENAFTQALQSDKKTFILFDDAHNDTKLLNQVISIINHHKNAKLVLTVRTAAYDNTISSIASHQQNYVKISLDRLDYDEIKGLFISQLPWAEPDQIVMLTTRSSGVPIVILAMAVALSKGISAHQITEDEAFTRYVLNCKRQIIDSVYDKTFFGKEKINKIIQLLCLVSPIKDNEEEITLLGNLNSINYDETEAIIATLHKIGFVERKPYSIAIKPDPYSEIILLESVSIIKQLIQNTLSTSFKGRTVKNLMLVEHSDKFNLNMLNILSDFISHIVSLAEDNKQKGLHEGLETCLTFTYKKPEIAIFLLKNLLTALDRLQPPDPMGLWFPGYIKEINEDIDRIFSTALLNTHGYHALKQGLDVIIQYIKLRSDYTLLGSAFRYRVYDFYEYRYDAVKNCERQEFLLSEMEEYAKPEVINNFDQDLIMEALELLLKLEFGLENFYEAHTGQFTFGNAQVPENAIIKDIRTRSFALTLSVYPKLSQERKKRVIRQLSRPLLFMRDPKEDQAKKYNQADDLRLVVPFLLKLAEEDQLDEERGSLLRSMNRYRRDGVKAEFIEDFDTLHQTLSKVETSEEKFNFFLDHEFAYVKENAKTEVERQITDLSDLKKFFEMFLKIKRETCSPYRLRNIHTVLQTMIKDLPEHATALLNIVLEENASDASDFVYLIKASYHKVEDFYKKVRYFWDRGDLMSKSTAVWILIFGRNGDNVYLQTEDLDYFDEILRENNKDAITNLGLGLHNYLHKAPDRTLELMHRLFKVESNESAIRTMMTLLFEDKAAVKDNSEALKRFLFESTIEIPFDDSLLESLQFLEDYFGFDVLVDYLFKKERYLVQNQDYSRFDQGFRYNNEKIPTEKHEENFLDLIIKMIDHEVNASTNILKILTPEQNFSDNFKNLVLIQVDNHKGNKQWLLSMAHEFRIFGELNENFFAILCIISNHLAENCSVLDAELVSIFPQGFFSYYSSRWNATEGPHPQDLYKKKLIEDAMARNIVHRRMVNLFSKILYPVNKSIDEKVKKSADL